MNHPILTLKRSDPHSHLGDFSIPAFRVRKFEKMVENHGHQQVGMSLNSARGRPWQTLACRVESPSFCSISHAIDQVPRVLSRIVPLPPQNQTLASSPIGSMYAIYGNIDPINRPPMLAYIPAPMDPMGLFRLSRLKRCSEHARLSKVVARQIW